MPEAMQAKFACPSCGRQFTWKPELAGRAAKCKCGNTIKVPARPAAAAPPAPAPAEGNPLDAFEFSEPAAEPAPAKKAKPQAAADAAMRCPSCGQSLSPGAVICVNCGFNLKTGKRMNTMTGDAAPQAAPAAAPSPVGAFGIPTGRRTPQKEKADVGGMVKMVAIPVVLLAVVGGAVFGFRKLSGEKDTGPQLGKDAEVRRLIKDGGEYELKDWLGTGPQRMLSGMTREQAAAMADRLYEMGAKKVITFGGVMSLAFAVELPEDKEKRKAIFDWYRRKYEAEFETKRQRDEGQRYLLVRPGL